MWGDFVTFTFINSQICQICYVHMCFFPKIFKKIVFNQVQFFHTFVLNDSQLCQKCHLHIQTHKTKFGQILSDHLHLTKKTSKLYMAKLRAKYVTFTFAFVQKIIKIDLAKFRKVLSPSLLCKAKFFKNVKFIIEPCAFFQKHIKNASKTSPPPCEIHYQVDRTTMI